MKISVFLRDRLIFIITIICAVLLCGFVMYVTGAPAFFVFFIGAVYVFGTAFGLMYEYTKKNAYYKTLLSALEGLDKKYYIAEVMEPASFGEGEILAEILKTAGKSMNDEIAAHARDKRDYREYIELWVHEVKTPISGARLICENSGYDELTGELDEIEKYVEQALFYARSGSVEKDYIIRKTDIKNLISDVVRKNSGRLIARKIKPEIRAEGLVHTDPKWLGFILQQILDNAVKYSAKTIVYSFENNILTVTDDGIGIPPGDLPRVFERGFTGENGRKTAKSTGLGLYLCKKLCDKLGLEIAAASAPNGGASISIAFPENPYLLHQ
ncbi:sensor histidine kinase [Clostridia bacterium]|nr:sensor histidine kinase [Clostridia bacterium]